jgi:hypothetical protein
MPVVLTFSFVPQVAEDGQGVICHISGYHLAVGGIYYFRDILWCAFEHSDFCKVWIRVILEKDHSKIMNTDWIIYSYKI